jgi:hypothetical protein
MYTAQTHTLLKIEEVQPWGNFYTIQEMENIKGI